MRGQDTLPTHPPRPLNVLPHHGLLGGHFITDKWLETEGGGDSVFLIPSHGESMPLPESPLTDRIWTLRVAVCLDGAGLGSVIQSQSTYRGLGLLRLRPTLCVSI